jgi:hypothetical protein
MEKHTSLLYYRIKRGYKKFLCYRRLPLAAKFRDKQPSLFAGRVSQEVNVEQGGHLDHFEDVGDETEAETERTWNFKLGGAGRVKVTSLHQDLGRVC